MSLFDRRDSNWRTWPEYKTVIEPLVQALKKRGHKPVVGKGFWQKTFTIMLTKGAAVDVSVSHSGRRRESLNRGAWLVLIGEERYSRSSSRSRFPEPRAGLDFSRMADAVEQHSKSIATRQRQERETKKAEADWHRLVNALPKSMRAYGLDVDAHGVSVTLRFENIEHVVAVLKAAQSVGVEP